MKRVLFLVLTFILFYTRFVNLEWGLPYPMHPDERNMANAVQNMNCNFKLQVSSFPTSGRLRGAGKFQECFNPHFFAYGQFPLYLAYGGIQAYHFIFGITGPPSYIEATLALRTISALSSVLLVFVLLKIIKFIYPKKKPLTLSFQLLAFSLLIFQPYAIQLSHFGTTESLLMLFYILIIYFSLLLLSTFSFRLSTTYIFLLALFSGLALGTKVSSLLFLGVPIIVILIKMIEGISFGANPKGTKKFGQQASKLLRDFGERKISGRIYRIIANLFIYLSICLFIFILSSPHTILNWNDFISSITYESRVGLGRFVAFYTRQFVQTPPVVFQFTNILPYALGWPTLIGEILGFFLLPSKMGQFIYKYVRKVAVVGGLPTRADSRIAREHWRDGKQLAESSALLDILRISLLLSFLPSSFFFTKWTRFIAPSFPLFSLFATLFLIQFGALFILKIKNQKSKLHIKFQIFTFLSVILIFSFCIFILILPGISYLSIYLSPDVRFSASEWMYKNIPANSKILSETANAIDLPIAPNNSQFPPSSYLINSFNFYDLDQSLELQDNLNGALQQADYIIVPSRRIFSNHTCFNSNTEEKGQETEKCKELEQTYPLLNTYYRDLFSGKLGFKKVAEFSSYPSIKFQISPLRQGFPLLPTQSGFEGQVEGQASFKFQFDFPDENAEETWAVFDHPVIRIYERIKNKEERIKRKTQNNLNFSTYNITNYKLQTTNYNLLVANTPEKWEKGLMYVKNKNDIEGKDGMIFIFPDSRIRSFWNKNTLSSLKLYWIEKEKIIGVSNLPSIIETGTINTVTSPSIVDTVIEIIK